MPGMSEPVFWGGVMGTLGKICAFMIALQVVVYGFAFVMYWLTYSMYPW